MQPYKRIVKQKLNLRLPRANCFLVDVVLYLLSATFSGSADLIQSRRWLTCGLPQFPVVFFRAHVADRPLIFLSNEGDPTPLTICGLHPDRTGEFPLSINRWSQHYLQTWNMDVLGLLQSRSCRPGIAHFLGRILDMLRRLVHLCL